MKRHVPKPDIYTPPRKLIAVDDTSGILLPSYNNSVPVVSVMEEYDIPLLVLSIGDPPSWTNKRIMDDFEKPRTRQTMIFGDISDPDLLAASMFARETGFEVFAIPSNPNFNEIHSLLAWMALRDNFVTVMSLKQVSAQLELVHGAPKNSFELENYQK